MHPDERPTVSMTEARRAGKRWLVVMIAMWAALAVLNLTAVVDWPWTAGLATIVIVVVIYKAARWAGYIEGRQAADLDYWRRQREGRL